MPTAAPQAPKLKIKPEPTKEGTRACLVPISSNLLRICESFALVGTLVILNIPLRKQYQPGSECFWDTYVFFYTPAALKESKVETKQKVKPQAKQSGSNCVIWCLHVRKTFLTKKNNKTFVSTLPHAEVPKEKPTAAPAKKGNTHTHKHAHHHHLPVQHLKHVPIPRSCCSEGKDQTGHLEKRLELLFFFPQKENVF